MALPLAPIAWLGIGYILSQGVTTVRDWLTQRPPQQQQQPIIVTPGPTGTTVWTPPSTSVVPWTPGYQESESSDLLWLMIGLGIVLLLRNR